DIELTLHTPYYMDLADADGLAQKSVQSVIWGGMLAEAMRAPIVITHLGMFGELDPKEALNRIAKNLRTVRDAYKKAKIHSRLGIEASGRTEVVGSLDEILTLVKNAKGVLPVLNFAHVHARGFGLFKRPEDFDDVLSKVEKVSDGGHIHAHFSGVEHADGNELRYTPIKKGDLRFEPLAACLQDHVAKTLAVDRTKVIKESLGILTSAKKLFVYGVGRSGLAARAFAMRMVQLGIDCYFIGETITPVVSDGDAVLIVSNTGS